jgi:hypothetical protein
MPLEFLAFERYCFVLVFCRISKQCESKGWRLFCETEHFASLSLRFSEVSAIHCLFAFHFRLSHIILVLFSHLPTLRNPNIVLLHHGRDHAELQMELI